MRMIRSESSYRHRALVAMLLLAAVAAFSACELGTPSAPSPVSLPDVLLVTIDTLRADHSSAYGYVVPTMPSLERLARRGTLFERVYAPTATTSPSHAALMTGRYPRTLGVMKNGHKLAGRFTTLAEVLGEAGYQTAAFVSSIPLRAKFGFDQGFEHYDDLFTVEGRSLGRPDGGRLDRRAERTTEAVSKWMADRHDPRPLFVWVHYVDPHAPYQAPTGFEADWPAATTQRIKAYDGEIRFADSQLGRLAYVFERSGPKAGTLTVVTSDHGEGLGQHGWMFHGLNLYEEAVRIPLVVAWSGKVEAGVRVAGSAELMDVSTSILGLLGVEAPPSFVGRDLFSDPQPRPVYLERRPYRASEVYGVAVAGQMHAVVDGDSKLVLSPDEDRRELYDLSSDPGETLNMAGRSAERAARLAGLLGVWAGDNPAQAPLRAEPGEGLRKRLESLGYVD